MEGISFRTGRRSDLTGEDGTIGQRVAAREIRSISALNLYAVRDDERVVERIIHIVIVIMFGRTRRCVPVGILAADGTVRIIALQPYFYIPVFIRLIRHIRTCLAFVIFSQGHQVVFVSSCGIKNQLQFLLTSCVLRRISRSVTTVRSEGHVEDRLTRMSRRIGLDRVRRVELVRTHINLAVLHAFRKRHIVLRQHRGLYCLIHIHLFDVCIRYAFVP